MRESNFLGLKKKENKKGNKKKETSGTRIRL